MTQDEIIRMAREAGCYQERDDDGTRFMALPESSWGKFAALVAEATKEKAAKVCEGIYPTWDGSCIEERYAIHAVKECAEAIRSMK